MPLFAWESQESREWIGVFNPGTHDDDFEKYQTAVIFSVHQNDDGCDAWDAEIEHPAAADNPLYDGRKHGEAVIEMVQAFLKERGCDTLGFGTKKACKFFDAIMDAAQEGKFPGYSFGVDYGGQLSLNAK